MFGRRQKQKRAFQPALDQGVSLESRCLLSVAGRNLIPPPAVRQNFVLPQTKSPLATGGLPTHTENYVQTGVGSGGRVAVLVDTDGEIYAVHVTGGGSVRAKAVPGGRVDLTIYGSNPSTVVSIDPEPASITENSAHGFATGTALHDGLIHVRNIKVQNGLVSEILGYRTAEVSGQINTIGRRSAENNVSRIAMFQLSQGSSVVVGGDLDTLDIYRDVFLDGGSGISIGRDLNWFNTGGNVTLTNGASVIAGRDIGLIQQSPKGSGPAGTGIQIDGSLALGPNSTITPLRNMAGPMVIQGSLAGSSNLPLKVQTQTIVLGDVVS
jgi:hypothetical protein